MTAGLPVSLSAWPRVRASMIVLGLLLAADGAEAASGARHAPDVTPPKIRITAPLTEPTLATSEAQVTLAGRASDDRRLARVTWRNTAGGSGAAVGTRSWSTPPIALVAGENRIVVTAYDRAGNSTADTLLVTRTPATAPPPPVVDPEPVNRAPVIGGTAPTRVLVGERYDFTPSASDPDGDPLAFSVMGAPAWTALDPASGRLSGVPGAGDVGLVEGIVITASDGQDYASLNAFAIEVAQVTNGSATVSWLPPLQRVDGSALTNLAGYRIRYGTNAAGMDRLLRVDGAGTTSIVIGGLVPGKWYFAVTAVDAGGLESAPSNAASKTIL